MRLKRRRVDFLRRGGSNQRKRGRSSAKKHTMSFLVMLVFLWLKTSTPEKENEVKLSTTQDILSAAAERGVKS